jgi:hypothetical protein
MDLSLSKKDRTWNYICAGRIPARYATRSATPLFGLDLDILLGLDPASASLIMSTNKTILETGVGLACLLFTTCYEHYDEFGVARQDSLRYLRFSRIA